MQHIASDRLSGNPVQPDPLSEQHEAVQVVLAQAVTRQCADRTARAFKGSHDHANTIEPGIRLAPAHSKGLPDKWQGRIGKVCNQLRHSALVG